MQFQKWLEERAPTPNDPAPIIVVDGRPLHDDAEAGLHSGHVDDEAEFAGDSDPAAADLADFFCIIDYVDAVGTRTRRRVTFRSCRMGENGPLIEAICHERRAKRTFRLSRIRGIIDTNGEYHDPEPFLRRTFGMQLVATGAILPVGGEDNVATLRAVLHPELTILVAIARADKEFHRAELDSIETFVEREVFQLISENRLPDIFVIDDFDRLRPLIQGMRPQRDTLEGCLRVILSYDEARIERFARAVRQLIRADEQVTDEEADMLDWFEGGRAGYIEAAPKPIRIADLSDLTICFTGRLATMSRSAAEALVRNHGATVKTHAEWTPYKGRNVVVVGNAPGSKADKAREMGITVISEDEFLRMIGME